VPGRGRRGRPRRRELPLARTSPKPAGALPHTICKWRRALRSRARVAGVESGLRRWGCARGGTIWAGDCTRRRARPVRCRRSEATSDGRRKGRLALAGAGGFFGPSPVTTPRRRLNAGGRAPTAGRERGDALPRAATRARRASYRSICIAGAQRRKIARSAARAAEFRGQGGADLHPHPRQSAAGAEVGRCRGRRAIREWIGKVTCTTRGYIAGHAVWHAGAGAES